MFSYIFGHVVWFGVSRRIYFIIYNLLMYMQSTEQRSFDQFTCIAYWASPLPDMIYQRDEVYRIVYWIQFLCVNCINFKNEHNQTTCRVVPELLLFHVVENLLFGFFFLIVSPSVLWLNFWNRMIEQKTFNWLQLSTDAAAKANPYTCNWSQQRLWIYS